MAEIKIESQPEAAQNNGVINPYALAEYLSGRKIAWDKLDNVPQVLESILQTPYAELFDPKYEGPLYSGLKLNKKGTLERIRSPLLDVKLTVGRKSPVRRQVLERSRATLQNRKRRFPGCSVHRTVQSISDSGDDPCAR